MTASSPTDGPDGAALARLGREMTDRSWWQILGSYAVGAWIVAQAAETFSSLVGLPLWFGRFVVILLLVGGAVLSITAIVQGAARGRSSADPAVGATRWLTWRNALRAGVVAFIGLGVVTAAYMMSRSTGIGPGASLRSSGELPSDVGIVVADFSADDEELGLALSEALRVDLAPVGAVPASVMAQAASRMDLSPGPVGIGVAREMAVREGYGALLAGELSRVGERYLITVRVEALDGRELLSVREDASGPDDLLEALDRLSRRIRERIGESLRSIQQAPGLARVTTSSVEALRSYTLAQRAMLWEGETDRAAALLEEAIARDTAFAMAYRLLGAIRGNQRNRSAQVAALTAAYRHRHRLSELERALTEATYHDDITSDRQRAIAAYQTVLSIDSTSVPALNNMGIVLQEIREFETAVAQYERAMRLEPNNVVPMVNLLYAQGALGDASGVAATIARMEDQLGESGLVYEMRGLWAAATRDWAGAEGHFRGLRTFAAEDAFYASFIPVHLAAVLAVRGRLDEAAAELATVPDNPAARLRAAAQIAGQRLHVARDSAAARELLDAALSTHPIESVDPLDAPYLEVASVLAGAGRPERARSLVDAFEAEVPAALRNGIREERLRVEGEIALAEGRAEDAVRLFRDSSPGICIPCAWPAIARALDAAGRPSEAIEAYLYYVEAPAFDRVTVDQFFLAHAMSRLATLYAEAGDIENARRWSTELGSLLEDADAAVFPLAEGAGAAAS